MQSYRTPCLSCRRTLSASKGFTIVELLVVIGMIAILMGILFPVIKKVRYAAYGADTQNEISQLSNACNAYYTSFHAYPGPFSNDDISSGGGAGSINGTAAYLPLSLKQVYLSPTTSIGIATPPWNRVTGAQNLVLGLLGGLRPISGRAFSLAFAPAEVGLGPLSLNPANPSRFPSFFSAASNYLMWCQKNTAGQIVQTTGTFQNLSGAVTTYSGTQFTDAAGTQAADCPIPVFVDRYPAPGPLPILYLRARTGAKGIVWDNANIINEYGTSAPAYYQYDLRDITPYTMSHIGLAATDAQMNTNSHNLTGISLFPPFMTMTNAPHPAQINNAGPYFMNTSIPRTSTLNTPGAIDLTGQPRAVDQFILISAGPDGIYGTPDDITSFGSVSQ